MGFEFSGFRMKKFVLGLGIIALFAEMTVINELFYRDSDPVYIIIWVLVVIATVFILRKSVE